MVFHRQEILLCSLHPLLELQWLQAFWHALYTLRNEDDLGCSMFNEDIYKHFLKIVPPAKQDAGWRLWLQAREDWRSRSLKISSRAALKMQENIPSRPISGKSTLR